MKKIGFMGAYDKTNLILNVAKILVEADKKVLIVDGTIMQRFRYLVPKMKNEMEYITEFESIDIAVGFINFMGVSEYTRTTRTSI